MKQGLGEALSSLEVPDDLATALEGLRGLVSSATSDGGDGGAPGADASSALGLALRRLFLSYTAMPFEVGGPLLPTSPGICALACLRARASRRPPPPAPRPPPRADPLQAAGRHAGVLQRCGDGAAGGRGGQPAGSGAAPAAAAGL